jgi:fatty-acyl-CoA synthase/long-chain acyl-CoA synthetase
MGDVFSNPTSSQLLLTSLRRHSKRPAITVGEQSWSYAQIDEMSDRLAGFLAAQGVGPGVAVAVHLRNGCEYVVAEFAILKLAAVRVPLNELMGAPELTYCLEHSGAKVLITNIDLPKADRAQNRLIEVIVGLETAQPLATKQFKWSDALADQLSFERLTAEADDTAIIAYTGGTTGRPKGVRHTYGRMAWNLFSHINCLDIRAEEVILLTTPLPHSSGYHMVAGFLQGAHIVIEPKFDADRFFKLCRELSVTWTMMVPTMLYRLLDHPAAGSSDHNALATIVYGAAPINRARLEEGLRKFGKIFLQIYGQTECPNLITTLSKDDHTNPHLLTSCGQAVPLVELRLRPDESGAGEVEVSSPYLLTEYYKDPVITKEALGDGWLKTGDLARLENGYLFLVDRAKDMIISGGMNIYSTEVESVLREHPGVKEAAVVGIPDPDWGEAVTAVVIANDGSTPEAIRQFAKARLSAYKVPKSIHIIMEMPLTQYGKIDKRRVRAMMVEEMGAVLGADAHT